MNKPFDKERFIQLLNQQTLLTKEKVSVSIRDWKETPNKNRNAKDLSLGCSLKRYDYCLYLNFEIKQDQCLEYTNRFFDEEHFDRVLTKILLEIDFPCFLLKIVPEKPHSGQRLFKPLNENGERLLTIFEPLKPYFQMYPSTYQPRITFPHFRHEMSLHFNHEALCIDVRYNKELLASLKNPDETSSFITDWLEKSHVIDRILQKATDIAKKYDPAAFFFRDSLCIFSRDMHLGFSYYQEKDTLLYFFTSFLLQERAELTTTDTEELSNFVLSYFERSVKALRLQALFEDKVGNYLYRLLAEMMGYFDKDFDDYFYHQEEFNQAKAYVNDHFHSFTLTQIDNDKVSLPEEYELERAFQFGDLYFFIEEDRGKYRRILSSTQLEYIK